MTRPWPSAALLILPVLLVLLGGCGIGATADVIGVAGVVRGDDGKPVLVVRVCRKDVDTVAVYASRRGLAEDQPNPTLAAWTTRRPEAGLIRFPLTSPPAGWAAGPGRPQRVHLDPARQYVVLAGRSQEDAEVTQVSFRPRSLRHLPRDQVLVEDGQRWSLDRFEKHACDGNDG